MLSPVPRRIDIRKSPKYRRNTLEINATILAITRRDIQEDGIEQGRRKNEVVSRNVWRALGLKLYCAAQNCDGQPQADIFRMSWSATHDCSYRRD